MIKRSINTALESPQGKSFKAIKVVQPQQASSVPQIDLAEGFALVLRISAEKKYSFAYNVSAAQRRRANLRANRGRQSTVTDQE